MAPTLAPAVLIADDDRLAQLVHELSDHPIIAVDTESNSLHAYRERVCLIQFSTSAADFIVDPIKVRELQQLADVFANPAQQKVFHAAEGDIIGLRRDYQFEFTNLFDTMIAARSLGWPQVGLAAILGPSLLTATTAIGVAGIPAVIRVTRSETLRLRGLDFIACAVADGSSDLVLLRRHILPNAVNTLIVLATVAAPASSAPRWTSPSTPRARPLTTTIPAPASSRPSCLATCRP